MTIIQSSSGTGNTPPPSPAGTPGPGTAPHGHDECACANHHNPLLGAGSSDLSTLSPENIAQADLFANELTGLSNSEFLQRTSEADFQGFLSQIQGDPIFALIMALIQAAESNQEQLADLVSQDFDMSDSFTTLLQEGLHEIKRMIEAATGMQQTAHDTDDSISRGWSN